VERDGGGEDEELGVGEGEVGVALFFEGDAQVGEFVACGGGEWGLIADEDVCAEVV
jgi:hypothetical protein